MGTTGLLATGTTDPPSPPVDEVIFAPPAVLAVNGSNRRLPTVLVPDPVVVMFALDAKGVFTFSEGSGLGVLRLRPGELVGKSVFDVYRETPTITDNVRRALRGEAFVAVIETPGPVFECSYNPLRGAEGAVVGIVGIAIGVTIRRQTVQGISGRRRRSETAAFRGCAAFVGPQEGAILELPSDELVGRCFTVIPYNKHEEALGQGPLCWAHLVSASEAATSTAVIGSEKRSCSFIFGREDPYREPKQNGRGLAELRRAEEALEKTEELYRSVCRATNEVIWDSDLIADTRMWDGALFAAFGYPVRQVTKAAWWEERIHPDDRERVLSNIRAVLRESGETWSDEYRFRCADGSYATVADRGCVVRDRTSGEPTRLIGSMTNVTEHKRIEEALRESEKRFQNAFEAASVGMAHVAPEGRWLRINSKLCEILGYEREELIETNFLEITSPEDVDTERERWRRMLANELGPRLTERRWVRKDGSSVWVDLAVSVIRKPSGEPGYFNCVADDITERKLAQLVPEPLTLREHEVLTRIAAGRTNEQVSKDLRHSLGTVKLDVRRIFRKLGVKNRTEASARAIEIGLISPRPDRRS
jgi:PAS domain S-box-containing protein